MPQWITVNTVFHSAGCGEAQFVGAMVRLEVFDAQGRRVAQLVNRYFVPGGQAVTWDHRSLAGSLVRPGVYLYRLAAGLFRDQKRMVLLP